MANRIRVRVVKPYYGHRRNPGERGKVWLIGRTDDGTLEAIEVDELRPGLPYMVPDWWTTTWGPFSKADADAVMSGRRSPGALGHQSVRGQTEERAFSSSGDIEIDERTRARLEEAFRDVGRAEREREAVRHSRSTGIYGLLHERVSAAARTAAPEWIVFLPIHIAKRLPHNYELRMYDAECYTHRARGGCWKRVRVASRVKTWVREPARVEFSVKYGLRQTIRVTERDITAHLIGHEGPFYGFN